MCMHMLRGLALACPCLIRELADVLTACVASATGPDVTACRDRFFAWKVVGVPKLLSDPSASQAPCCVPGTVLCCAVSLPCQPTNTLVHPAPVQSPLAWLGCVLPVTPRVELDLRKALDSVVHDLAVCAGALPLGLFSVIRLVRASLLRCAWGSALQAGPGYVGYRPVTLALHASLPSS